MTKMEDGDQFTTCVCGHQRRYHEGEEMDGRCILGDRVSCTCTCTEFRMGPADPPEQDEGEVRFPCPICEEELLVGDMSAAFSELSGFPVLLCKCSGKDCPVTSVRIELDKDRGKNWWVRFLAKNQKRGEDDADL